MSWLINGYTSNRAALSSLLDEQRLVEAAAAACGATVARKKPLSFVGGTSKYDPAEGGWVLVVPDDDEGRAIAAELEPLVEHRLRVRDEDAEAKPRKKEDAVLFFPAKAAADPIELASFVDAHLGFGKLGESPPFYVLVAGSPAKIPFALEQHLVAGEHAAGRLAFSSIDHYGVYARKVVAWEPDEDFPMKPRKGVPVGIFATDHGAGDATHESLRHMAQPFLSTLTQDASRPVVARVKGEATRAALSSLLGRGVDGFTGPRLLFSATHGLAIPGAGRNSERERLERQGAILCQNGVHLGDEDTLDAAGLANGAALAGGIWVMHACFGAGTPRASEFSRVLHDPSYSGFHQGGPFVAALPTRLLENEDGPLAVVGHLDPSFVHAFSDPNGVGGERSNAIYSILHGLLRGTRVGIAISALPATANRYGTVLFDIDREVARILGKGLIDADAAEVAAAIAAAKEGDPLRTVKERLVDYAVSRNDFKNFLILGDPAVKLPRKGATRTGSSTDVSSFSGPSVPSTPSSPTFADVELPRTMETAFDEGRLVLATAEDIFSEKGVELPETETAVVALVASTCADVRVRPGEEDEERGAGPKKPAPFFEAAEHMACDVWAPIKLSATEVNRAADFRFELTNGVTLRYGEAIAVFGDFFGIPGLEVASGVDAFMRVFATFDRGDKYELVRILNLVAAERREVTPPLAQQASTAYEHAGISFVEKYNVATGGGSRVTPLYPLGRFLALADVNFDHFGKNATAAYCAGHEAALRQAIAARGQETEEAQRKGLLRAYIMNACADHFLTDVFASGHLRVPRRELVQQIKGYKIGSLLAKRMHDEDNRLGLTVKNKRGDSWKTYGDGYFLNEENALGRRITREAVKLSAEEVWTAFETGEMPTFRALDLLPDVDEALTSTDNHAPMFIVKNGVVLARKDIKDRNCREWTPKFVGAIELVKVW